MKTLVLLISLVLGVLAAPPLVPVYRPPTVPLAAVPSHQYLHNLAYHTAGSIAAPHHFATPSNLVAPLNSLLHFTALPVGQLYNPLKTPVLKLAEKNEEKKATVPAPVVYSAPLYTSYPIVKV